MTYVVDVVVLTRDPSPVRAQVMDALRNQQEVKVIFHQVVGDRRPGDVSRLDAIVRARNVGKKRGDSPFLMFVDDDVVLNNDCIRTLIEGLVVRPSFAGLGADYSLQQRGLRIAQHVTMGATLFRRAAIEEIDFRWEEGRCECLCCCLDLRDRHWGIDYLPQAKAIHMDINRPCDEVQYPTNCAAHEHDKTDEGVVLACFNQKHCELFVHQFLTSLRRSGNHERVFVVAIGVNAEQRELLESLGPKVRCMFASPSEVSPARLRLRYFPQMLGNLPSHTPAAYWDAGDVVFQGRLHSLWQRVRRNREKIAAAVEPIGYPENVAVGTWMRSVEHRYFRRTVINQVKAIGMINSGFVAGQAGALIRYFETVKDWYDQPVLRGSTDWGDQVALNLYFALHPQHCEVISDAWNYCLFGRDNVGWTRGQRLISGAGDNIVVVHGNAKTLHTPPVKPMTRQFGLRAAV